MSADHDGDSRMASSPEDSENELATPANQIANPILSPPDSQHHSQAMPTAASGVSGANANGKRPIQTISSGADDDLSIISASTAKPRQEFPPKTHKPSGYTWSRMEDEPGHAWTNKKALDESHRAWDQLVHRDHMVKNRYGDPFEVAEREQAMLASLKQR